MGKQFLIGTTLGILSLLPFFPLALHTTYDLVIFCHPTEAEDGGDNESQTGVFPNMEIDFGGEDNTAYVTNVTHGEDTANLSNTQALKQSLAQLEGINSELLVPNLESMKHGIKEPEVIRSGSDKGSLEGFNAESNTGFPGIKESSVKPATSQCRVISTAEIEEQPTNVRTWTIWHRKNTLRISDKPFPSLRVLQDARSAQASYVCSIPPKPPDRGSLAHQHAGWIASMADSISLPFSVEFTPTVWTIWTHRNQVRTNHPCCSPNQLANKARELLTKFQAVQQPSLPQSTPIRVRWRAPILDMGTGATQTDQGSRELPLKEGPIKAQSMAQYQANVQVPNAVPNVQVINSGSGGTRWRCPQVELVKINFDGAVFSASNMSGFRVVIRNSNGAVLASCSQKIPQAYKAKVIEALAALKALSFAFELGFCSAIHQRDSLGLIQALKSEKCSLSPTSLLIEDVKMFSNNFVKLLYSHVKRNGNRITHSLAKNALCIPDFQVWMKDVPSHIVSILSLDVVELH